MTAELLSKWIEIWEPEWRWDVNSYSKEDDVIIWISIYAIESFYNLLDPSVFNDGGGLDARLVNNHVAIFMSDICDHFGIEMEQVFPKNNDNG